MFCLHLFQSDAPQMPDPPRPSLMGVEITEANVTDDWNLADASPTVIVSSEDETAEVVAGHALSAP